MALPAGRLAYPIAIWYFSHVEHGRSSLLPLEGERKSDRIWERRHFGALHESAGRLLGEKPGLACSLIRKVIF